jgi:hypothetical protein
MVILAANRPRTWPMDHRSIRDQLIFAIGYVASRSRGLLSDILKQHVSDGAREQLGKRVVEHLELSGFEIDEKGPTIRKKPPTKNHG